MTFAAAYAQAKELGRKIRMGTTGAFFNPDSVTTLSPAQAISNEWEVSNETSIAITPTMLAARWDAAVQAGGFRSVKPAAASDLFKELSRSVFGG